jgi:hypothetical protein
MGADEAKETTDDSKWLSRILECDEKPRVALAPKSYMHAPEPKKRRY